MESRDVVALIRAIADELGPSVAHLRTETPLEGILTLELIPTNRESAPVGVRIADAGLTDAVVSIGETGFEIPAEGAGHSGGSGLEDIRHLVNVAIDGRFYERVWYRGANEIRREGIYLMGDREVKLTHESPSWFLGRKGKVRERRFAAYRST